MAQNNDLTIIFNFKSKVTGREQIAQLKTTYDNLAKGIDKATLAANGFNKAQVKASKSALDLLQAKAGAGIGIESGVLGISTGGTGRRRKASTPKVGLLESMGFGGNKVKGLLSTVGFGGMQVAHAIGRSLDSVNFAGVLAPTIEKIGTGIGSIFGSVIGSVFGDVSRAVGLTIETILQHYLIIIRTMLKAVGGMLGGIFLALIGAGVTGPIGIVLGLVTGLFNAIITIISGAVELIMNIIKGAFAVIGSLITAGLTIVKSIFEGITGAIGKLWEGFWEGLKGVAEVFWNAVVALTQEGLNQLKQGFTDLIESERLAAKAYIQVTDVGTNKSKQFAEGVYGVRKEMDKLSTSFGIDTTAAADVMYKMLSGGYRDVAEATLVAIAAMKLNLVTQGSVAVSADMLRGSLQAWGESAEKAGDYAAQLSAAIKIGAFNADAYGTALANVSGTAHNAGMSLREVNAFITTVSLKSLTAARITIGLEKTIVDLRKSWSSLTAKKTLGELGFNANIFKSGKVSMEDILKIASKMESKDMYKIFKSKQSQRFMQFVMNDVEGVRKRFVELGDATQEFEKDVENMKGMWFFMKAQIIQIGIAIRRDILDPFDKVLKPILASIGNTIKTVFGGIDFKTVFSGLATSLTPLFREIGGFVRYIVEEFGMFLKGGGFNKIFSSDVFKQIVYDATRLLKILWNLPEALNTAFPIFDKFGGIGEFLVWCFDQITDPANWTSVIITFEKMVAWARFIVDIFKNTFTTGIFGDVMVALFDSLLGVIRNLGIYLITVFTTSFNIIADFFMANFGVKLKKIATEFVGFLLTELGRGLANLSGSFREKAVNLRAGGEGSATRAEIKRFYSSGLSSNPMAITLHLAALAAAKAMDEANARVLDSMGNAFGSISGAMVEGGKTFKNMMGGTNVFDEESKARGQLIIDMMKFDEVIKKTGIDLQSKLGKDWEKTKKNLIKAVGPYSGTYDALTQKMDELNFSQNHRMGIEGILGKSYIRPGGTMYGGWNQEKKPDEEPKMKKYLTFATAGMLDTVIARVLARHPDATYSARMQTSLGGTPGMRLEFQWPEKITDPLKQTADTTTEKEDKTTTSLNDIAKNTGELVEIFRPLRYKGNMQNASGGLQKQSRIYSHLMDAGYNPGMQDVGEGN